jgi:hypothetical protein
MSAAVVAELHKTTTVVDRVVAVMTATEVVVSRKVTHTAEDGRKAAMAEAGRRVVAMEARSRTVARRVAMEVRSHTVEVARNRTRAMVAAAETHTDVKRAAVDTVTNLITSGPRGLILKDNATGKATASPPEPHTVAAGWHPVTSPAQNMKLVNTPATAVIPACSLPYWVC